MKNNIQRIIAIVLLLSMCLPVSLVAEINDWGIYRKSLNGFDFGGYKPETGGLKPIIKGEADALSAEFSNKTRIVGKEEEPNFYALVGHSQGGLRALAISTELKNRAEDARAILRVRQNDVEAQKIVNAYDNLQAVITVSGANKGMKALEGGFAPISARLMTDVNTIWRGTLATQRLFNPAVLFSDFFLHDISAVTKLLVTLLGLIDPIPATAYLAPALNGDNPDTVASIRDMIPHSDFIQEYVADTKMYQTKVLTGSRWAWEWRKKWGWFRYLVHVRHPVYSYYSYGQDIPKFDDNLPIGYIVGAGIDTIDMVSDEDLIPGIGNGDLIRGTLKGFAVGFGIVEGAHYLNSLNLWGLMTGSPLYARYAGRAREWMWNPDSQIDELLGSSNHDGILAVESQFYPKTFTNLNYPYTTGDVHKNVLVLSEGATYTERRLHHNAMNTDAIKKDLANELLRQATFQRK